MTSSSKPSFLIHSEFSQFISKRFEGKISTTEIVEKVDLDMVNHLADIKLKTIKLRFKNIANLMFVRNALRPIVQKNKTKEKVMSYTELLNPTSKIDMIDMIVDIREDDVPYHVRVCIDNEIRCGFWYKVTSIESGCHIQQLPDKLSKAPLTVLAFDIETTKAPLKFPDARIDSVMLISYMIDGDGYLITNRSIISEEIQDFQYTPKQDYEGNFEIFNEIDEESLLRRFILHCKERRPNIFVTFNGDYFDLPFLCERMKVYGINMEAQLGITNVTQSSKPGELEFMGRFAVHIDCLYWVRRDAFLPQGSHGLKAVTKAKLGYDPIEIDPEKMLKCARETPQQLCAYSVSDALATYYLYKLMIHDFIYALCTIIPTFPDEVLRKGSGTLCEELLMAQAFRRNIIFPNKQVEEFEKFHQGHLIESETYIGGHVECLNVGVYRNDITNKFPLDPTAYQFLIDNTEKYVKFCLEIENNNSNDPETEVENYSTVIAEIKAKLDALLQNVNQSPHNTIEVTPLIYHLDVSAMYPNIILTNRLQPVAIVDEQTCAGCLYNREENNCKRYLNWQWRGQMFPLARSEYENLKHQYEFELLQDTEKDLEALTVEDYRKLFTKRIKNYCSKVYKQTHVTKVVVKDDIVCMRENSFYVDTVRDFRDRRYEFKALVKTWKGKIDEAKANKDPEAITNARNMMDLFESLQLAHKIILNSFYGYVMRRGARWHSMEMAAMVTHIGSNIITDSKQLIDKIGKPLELDTDGIWCLLPLGFPESFGLKLKSGKRVNFSFPCTMLNALIYEKYCNTQYQIKDPVSNKYITRKEMSIFFEVDGPYRCMMIPAAKEEGKMLKKRYAVFSLGGKLHELKGFELKRRGELKLIKIFQSEVFDYFLKGNNLKECYSACSEIADRWFSILENQGRGINDEELLDYIEESRVMSKSVAEYGAQKSTSITCAKRLAEILGGDIVKDKGLCAKYIISKKPLEAPVAERAVPTVIFHSDPAIKRKMLRKWLKDFSIEDVDMRDVIDWNYYKDRLAGTILKILIIPAALQKIENPFEKIPYPDWVNKMMKNKNSDQRSLKFFFKGVSNVDKFLSISDGMDRIEVDKDILNHNKSATKKKTPGKEKLDGFMQPKGKRLEYESSENKTIMELDEIINKPTVNILDNFEDWLTQQKAKWKKNRLTERKQKQTNTNTNVNMSIQNMLPSLKNKEAAFKKSTIKIIQILEHNSLGMLRMWITFDNYIECVNVYLKRKIYINSHKSDVPDVFRPCKLILPRNKPVLNLYDFDLDEKEFKDKFNNFNDYIIDPSIEGIYESKVPLLFKAIQEYGCYVRYANKNKKLGNLSTTTFEFEDFEQKYVSEGSINENDLSKYYIYHSTVGARHFIALFLFPQKKVNVYVVNTLTKNFEIPNVKKIITNVFEKEIGKSVGDLSFNYEITTNVEPDVRIVMKNINKLLTDLKYNSNNIAPGMLIVQSSLKMEKLIQLGLSVIYNEYPVMEIPFNAEENNFPALDWVKFALRRLAYRYVDLKSLLDQRTQLSTYCNIPLCNLEIDTGIYCSDLIFSRILKSSKQVLWYSHSGFPDLGGGTDNHDFLGEVEYEFPKILNPGMYLGYSVEIDLGLFCVNAILESDHMKDMAGKYDMPTDAKQNNKIQVYDYQLERDEFVLGSNAFVMIKKMVEKWLIDVRQYENMCADYLLVHFYRWIASFNSKFFDPVIHRMINKLMYKYFSILVRKIKEFGFEIIYADYKKIFIFNNKNNLEDFQASIDYLIRTIKKIQIFNHITLTPNQYWKIILFKDYFNYAGISAVDDQNCEENVTPQVKSKWTLAEFLPPILEKDFMSLISDYIMKLYKFFYHKDYHFVSNLYNLYRNQDMSATEAKTFIENEANVKQFKQFLVSDYISHKVFNIIPNILKKKEGDGYEDEEYEDNKSQIEDVEKLHEEEDGRVKRIFSKKDFMDDNDSLFDDFEPETKRTPMQNGRSKEEFRKMWEFPTKLGSYQTEFHLALEYVKYISTIFEIDEDVRTQGFVLKRNCLKLIKVQDFSSEAEFHDPCRTFILHDVICEFCSGNKDIDFCRDKNVLSNQWTCDLCQAAYDKQLIEYLIIHKAKNVIDYYYNQDLKCQKCKMQKNEFIFTKCDCASDFIKTFEENIFKNNENISTIQAYISTLMDIANYYSFDTLKSMLNYFK